MESKIKNIFEIIKTKFNNLEKRDRIILIIAITAFIFSKILSIFNLSIPGLNVIPTALILALIGFNIVKNNKESSKHDIKSKAYFILGSMLSSISLLIFGCIALVYPFIILGAIML